MLEWALDGAIGAGLIWLAWKALSGEDLYRSVILYIAFGLVLALAWARLQAPDIALAEAAIGAGLTGALLLDAVAELRRRGSGSNGGPPAAVLAKTPPRARDPATEPDESDGNRRVPFGPAHSIVAVLGVSALGLAVAAALTTVSMDPGGLTAPARESLDRSGVAHGVTAVLLNFRAFDTFLEVGVLLAAVLAMLVARGTDDLRDALPPRTTHPVMTAAAAVVIPLMVLVGGYLLWLGTHAPGGAFQAGAVLASAAVLLFLAGRRSVGALDRFSFAFVLTIGFAAFLFAAIATALAPGVATLEFAPKWAETVIVLIEAMLTISIAATLAALFIGGRAREGAS